MQNQGENSQVQPWSNVLLPHQGIVVLQLLSHVQLFATPWTVARGAALSMGFPRQEYRSGLPFPFQEDLLNPRIEPRSPA